MPGSLESLSWRISAARSSAFLLPRSILDPDRCPHKPKGRANLVFQKPLVGEVELHSAIREEHERRRRNRRLRHVENLHPLAHWYRRAVEVYLLDETVHL